MRLIIYTHIRLGTRMTSKLFLGEFDPPRHRLLIIDHFNFVVRGTYGCCCCCALQCYSYNYIEVQWARIRGARRHDDELAYISRLRKEKTLFMWHTDAAIVCMYVSSKTNEERLTKNEYHRSGYYSCFGSHGSRSCIIGTLRDSEWERRRKSVDKVDCLGGEVSSVCDRADKSPCGLHNVYSRSLSGVFRSLITTGPYLRIDSGGTKHAV